MNKKLIVMDMDGTLSESRKEIDPEMKQLLHKLSRHYKIAIFSGADTQRIKNQINVDFIDTIYIGSYSSAKIIKGEEILFNKQLSSEQQDFINNVKIPFPGHYLDVNDYQATIYLVNPHTATEEERNSIDPKLKVRTFLVNKIKPYLNEYDVRIGGKTSIDISQKDTCKKTGIDFLCKHLNLETEEILFIGDRCFEGGNDYMFNSYDYYNVTSINHTKNILKSLIQSKETVVVVSGYFNPIHSGHIKMFQQAKKLGDKLIVIINNDKQVQLKGSIPFMNEKERAFIVQNIQDVDSSIISIDQDKTVCNTLKHINPHIFANGGDRFSDNVPEKKTCEELGIEMVFNIGGDKTQSSSWLIKEAVNNEKL